MTRPHDPQLTPAEARQEALAVLRGARFPFLATSDGNQPRLRPVSPVRTDGFTVYVANLRRYGKTAEIAANARVELGYLDANHNQVRITGIAETVTDRSVLQAIWDSNALLRQYLGSLENPELIVYRIRPSRVRFMREWALDYHEVPLGPDDEPAG
jgi:general stress protein 26